MRNRSLRADDWAAEALHKYADMVYRLAYAQTRNRTDADDIFQEVFIRLVKKGPGFESDEHMKAWLIRTTLNRCADAYRFRLRHPVLPLEAVPGLAVPAEEEGISPVELWAAVARLPEKLRTVVHLHYAEGYSTGELAAMLDIPAATVRTRLYRAREGLRKLLGGFDDEA